MLGDPPDGPQEGGVLEEALQPRHAVQLRHLTTAQVTRESSDMPSAYAGGLQLLARLSTTQGPLFIAYGRSR
jgi:hypothetical protein